MRYTTRFDTFLKKWLMEDEKGNVKAMFPETDEALASKVANALNAKGLDVT